MHCEAVEAVITLPRTTGDIGELLNKGSKQEKENSREMLQTILSCIRFLARQALALRGSNSDADSNFLQLLSLRAQDQPQLTKWLGRHTNKYISHECQNEMLEIMAYHVQRKIIHLVSESPFISLMVDETTDISNNQQLTIVLRRTDVNFDVYEDFLGMYQIKK